MDSESQMNSSQRRKSSLAGEDGEHRDEKAKVLRRDVKEDTTWSARSCELKKFDATELCKFVAKVSTLGQLLQSRLALPLIYPLNSRGMTDPLKASAMVSQKWRRSDVILGLAQVAPAALVLSRVGSLLRLAHACHRLPGTRPSKSRNATLDSAATKMLDQTKTQIPQPTRETVHFLRPQVWRVLKPGEERATKHLKWR